MMNKLYVATNDKFKAKMVSVRKASKTVMASLNK
jgi:hypothetical protein